MQNGECLKVQTPFRHTLKIHEPNTQMYRTTVKSRLKMILSSKKKWQRFEKYNEG